MDKHANKVGFFHSLRTQLGIGALLLLALTVSSISYFLIVNQKQTLTREVEKALVLLGRNIALSSQTALLHADPEIELYPLVTRITEQQKSVECLTVTDASGIIHGDLDVANVGKRHRRDMSGYREVVSPMLRAHEALYVDEEAYVLRTPVMSQDRPIGDVVLTYSKRELRADVNRGIRITITISAVSLVLGLLLALAFFRHISRPMQVLMRGVDTLAGGNLDTNINMPTRNEFRVLAEAFNEMAFRIAAAQKEHIVKERMDRELEIARDIQRTLLPEHVYVPSGYEIGHYYHSATEVGGDYLDVIRVGEQKLGVVMADVSGKGVPGLVVMAMTKIMVQNFMTKGVPPKEIVRKLNSALLGNIRRNMFVTFFVGILDTETCSMVFSNAGHNPAIIYDHDTGRARFFKMEGPPMGSFPDRAFAEYLREYRLDFAPGDLLLEYTDGLSESMNSKNEQFTMGRILDVINAHGSEGAAAVVEHLVQAEAEFRGLAPQSDDLTLLALSMKEAAVSPPNKKVAAHVVASR